MKRFLGLLLAAAMLLSLSATALAAVEDTGYTDVAADAWYAGAVAYVTENRLMTGTGSAVFSPNEPTDLAMLTTILHRDAGTPATTAAVPAGVPSGQWYTDAAAWANGQGYLANVNAAFTGMPLSREDMVTVLWRYAGSPVGSAEDFADESSISSYAVQAVDWARANGVVNGKGGNRFDPKGSTTRAELATILQNFLTLEPSAPAVQPETPSTNNGRTLVVYFSATNTTERVAQVIANTLNADILELEPVEPYTSNDLNYSNPSSRVCREHDDPSLQDIALVTTTPANWDEYDTVFIGYPIWWHAAAWPVNGFVTGNDFTGKTVVPFCTSASSGLEGSDATLKDMAGTGDWLSGRNFFSRDSEDAIVSWVSSLDIPKAPAQPAQAEEAKVLIAYFSMPETTDPNNMTAEEDNSTVVINGEVLGNTQYMAYVIQQTVGGDIFRIEPETPYPTDHTTLVAQAREEQSQDYRPVIKENVSNMEDYDVIFLGYPNWWGDMPMILYSFLEENDLSGKTIVPFNTHGGSGFSGTIGTIRQLEPQATVLDGMSISRNHIQDAEQEIIDWVSGMDIEQG